MASRQLSAKKPKDLGHTLRTLLSYLGRHKLLFLAVAVLVALSALANLLGTYMIRPVVNSLAAGSLNTLVLGVAVTAAIYGAGVLSALGYTQIMVKAPRRCSTTSGGICSPTSKPCPSAFLTPSATAM